MTVKEFIAKATAIHKGAYTYNEVMFLNQSDFVIIHCPKHGDFTQRVSVHIKDKCGCPKCGIENRKHPAKKTSEQFIAESKKVHGDRYDYSKVEYINAQTEVTIICPKHQKEFRMKPYAHIHQKQKCRLCGLEERKHPGQKTNAQFVKQAKKKWGDKYDYSQTQYINKNTKLQYRCSEHGVIEQLPTLHLKHG